MDQRLKVRLGGALVAVLGVAVLSGCASNTPIEDFSGLPLVEVAATDEPAAGGDDAAAAEEVATEELDVAEGETAAVYLNNGDRIAVVMWGSSTCPPVGSRLVVLEDANSGNSVRLDVEEIPADAVCTADLVPHTTVFGAPQQTTTTKPLLIDVNGEQVTIPVK